MTLPHARAIEIVELLASPRHRYEGRPADGPDEVPADERRVGLELRAGLGVVGDRYFGQRAHRESSVTLQSAEALAAVAARLGVAPPGLAQTRRTILVRGAAIDDLVGVEFAIEQDGAVIRFAAPRAANPCAWMDAAIGPGAHRALRGHGGLRTGPLDDGVLRVGPAVLHSATPISPATE